MNADSTDEVTAEEEEEEEFDSEDEDEDSQPEWTPLTNGLPSHPRTLPQPTKKPVPSPNPPASTWTPSQPISPPLHLFEARETLTVEIDPHAKPPGRLRSRSLGEMDASRGSCLCLPSPVSSILGPRKTLKVLSESLIPAGARPVREVINIQECVCECCF